VTAVLSVLASYLLGAVPASYVAGRFRGIDLRQHGSKNLGATNVYRVLGWRYAIPVALFDIAKGAIPVAVFGRWAGVSWDGFPAVLGVTAVMGHIFSPFIGFKGGKGVATAAGVFVALAPLALLIAATVWVVCLRLSGYVSLSSLAAAGTFPLWVRATIPDSRPALYASLGLAAAVFFTHRGNIRRLLAGTEHRFKRGAGRSDSRTVGQGGVDGEGRRSGGGGGPSDRPTVRPFDAS
jgi:glycerol-3-phosphate acyltransferase PlsY